MNNNKYIKEKIILYFLKFLMIGIVTGGLTYSWVKYYNPYIPTPFYELGNYLMMAVFAAVYVWFVKIYGGEYGGKESVSKENMNKIIKILSNYE